MLVAFGGLEGIEGIVESEEQHASGADEVAKMFDLYLNTCTEQGTRTIRTEEAILVSLAVLVPSFRKL